MTAPMLILSLLLEATLGWFGFPQAHWMAVALPAAALVGGYIGVGIAALVWRP